MRQTLKRVLPAALLLGSMGTLAAQDLPEIPARFLEQLPEEVAEDVRRSRAGLQSRPDDLRLLGRLAMLLHAHERYELAEDYYARAREAAPDQFQWTYYQAVVSEQQRKAEAAEKLYREALEIDSTYIPLRLRLADLLYDAGRWNESLPLYLDVLEEYPELAVAHYGAGRSLTQLERTGEAIEHLEQATSLNDRFGPAHYSLAQALREAGRLEEAKEHLERFQKYRLNRPVVGDGLLEVVHSLKTGTQQANRLLAEAVREGEAGNWEKSVELHRKVVEISPDLLQGYINLIILHGKKGEIEEARELYQKAQEIGPSSDDLHYNYGVTLFEADRMGEAEDAFLDVVQINPLHASAHNYLGQIGELKGDLQEAEEYYRLALEADPAFRVAGFNLGRILVATNRLEAAREQFSSICRERDRETARYLYALAATHVRLKELERALEVTDQALELARQYGETELEQQLQRDRKQLLAWLGKEADPGS